MESSGKRTKFRGTPLPYTLYSSKKQAGPVVMEEVVPKVVLYGVVKGWVAAVLSVLHHTGARNAELLRHKGRTSPKLRDARVLLIYLFMEVAGQGAAGPLAEAWLEQCVNVGRRTIKDVLCGPPPSNAAMAAAITTYSRLQRELGPDDVQEAIAAGVIGARHSRSRVWRKGFGQRLGLVLDT